MKRTALGVSLILCAGLGATAGSSSAGASSTLPAVVSANPADYTPNVVSNPTQAHTAVYALSQLGGTIYAGGGIFDTVLDSTRATTYSRHDIVAFSATTGSVTPFAPVVNGEVWAIQSVGGSVYIGGYFTAVNGVARRGVAKLDAVTGAVDRAFNARFSSGHVTAISLTNGRLIVGGSFPGQLRALNPATGANTGYIKDRITGQVASNTGPTAVYRFAVSPAGHRLVAIGNFTAVDGSARSRAFMLDLGITSSTLDPWYYAPLTRTCRAAVRIPQYLRGVDFSPNGRWFVIVATGSVPATQAGIGRDVCDAAARFESDVAAPVRPTWINYTGGDTMHSVAASNNAVYVQGHFRWLDNPEGRDFAGVGAVPRQGIGAIDPITGKALAWNPGKSRGVGGKALLVTSGGLWVGSDTDVAAGEHHDKIAFFPLP